MINRKADIFNLGGILFLICLFFLLISAFSNKPVNQAKTCIQFELAADLHSNSQNAVIWQTIQLPSFQKNLLSYLGKTNFKLFSENYKIISDNLKISRKFLLLQKSQRSVKPLIILRFYYFIFSSDSEELPVLS